MLPVVQQLLVLQERDQRIRALTKDLRDFPLLQQRAKSRLEDDETAVASALAAVRDIELKIKGLDLDAQTRRTSIGRIKEQQFQTRKNEEFQALSHEITRYENEVRALEDSELELMEQLEGVKPALATANAKLADTKRLVAEELEAITQRGKNLEAQLAEVKTNRVGVAAAIDPDILGLYDRLMRSKGDAAVVPLRGEICQGCHVKVVRDTQLKLRADDAITQCEQCGRILHLEE
jgi:predicted  nucleic acid-binding Zn-ribbon protein